MKRYAGEDGKCFATQETLMKKLGVGRGTYLKSLKYLLSKKWVKFIGMTGGKTRPVKTYSIVDIWKLNIMEYEKIPSETAVSFTGDTVQKEKDTVQNSSKIPSETAIEEEHILKKNYKEEPLPDWLDKEVWLSWISYKKERKEKLTTATISLQLRELKKDIPHHKQIIEQSIRNGWRGIFPLKDNVKSRGKLLEAGNKYEKYENNK